MAKFRFKEERTRALFAGCAGHSVLPLDFYFTAALGMVFSLSAHLVDWPLPKGGSENISKAMAAYFTELGGKIQTGFKVQSLQELPEAKAYLFDIDPIQFANIASDALPNRYKKRLRNFNYGPGSFKVDWALDGPIPWKDPRCLEASVMHIGGTIEEIAVSEKMAWQGKECDQSLSYFVPAKSV